MKNQTLTFFFAIILFQPLLGQKTDRDNPEFYLSTAKKKLDVILKAAQFSPGEQIADIGTGNGWVAAGLAIYTDSLSYTLEDIDSSFIKNGRFVEALVVAEKIKGAPITNTFTWVIGTAKNTNLPKSSFNKVLLIDTYHHIEHRSEMIRDLFSILKPGGKLIVSEPVGRKSGEIYKGCHSVVDTIDEILNAFTEQGFVHERTLKTVKSTRKRVRVFVFKRTS